MDRGEGTAAVLVRQLMRARYGRTRSRRALVSTAGGLGMADNAIAKFVGEISSIFFILHQPRAGLLYLRVSPPQYSSPLYIRHYYFVRTCRPFGKTLLLRMCARLRTSVYLI